MTILDRLQDIYSLLADDRIEKLGLFRIENGRLVTPFADNTLALFAYKSKRADTFVEQPVVRGIIDALKADGAYKGINHIGFCYKVDSKESEVKRITGQVGGKKWSVYRETSSDDAAWIFVGDISEVTNPMLEFLPHEGDDTDRWIDYWLPHVQFDIDTTLSPLEVETLVKKFLDRPFTPYSINIDGVTYIQRVTLGCQDGVNIILDISTNNRDINYRKTWTKLA